MKTIFEWQKGLRGEVPTTTFAVAMALSLYAGDLHKTGTWTCWPGEANLANDVGLSERRIRGHLKVLESDGWIRVKTAHSRQHATVWELVPASDRTRASGEVSEVASESPDTSVRSSEDEVASPDTSVRSWSGSPDVDDTFTGRQRPDNNPEQPTTTGSQADQADDLDPELAAVLCLATAGRGEVQEAEQQLRGIDEDRSLLQAFKARPDFPTILDEHPDLDVLFADAAQRVQRAEEHRTKHLPRNANPYAEIDEATGWYGKSDRT